MAQADSVPTPNHASNPGALSRQSTTKPRQIRIKPADRRYFVGGSEARIIMGSDEAALVRLWREKRGEIEPEDLSGNLIVQLGIATEDLNRRWYQANTGQVLTDVQRQIRHPALRWMAATLDGRVETNGAVFEAKFMLPWSFSEEAAAEKYMPQLQHNMWVVAARSAVLSVITGGGKWVEITTHADPLYQHLIVTAERKFWRCVVSGEPPRLFGVEPPKPSIEAVRIVDMSASNSWAEFADLFRSTRQAFLDHERSKTELKALMPEDAKEAIGIAAALAKAQAQLVNPEKSLVGTIRPDGQRGTEQTFRYAPLSSGLDIVRKTLSQHEIATVQITSIDESSGIVRLSTVLAHASGEWIGSDWPVCPITETTVPHRMGAALTYARRYALFTLIGIAGEDDLDAPDLVAPTPASSLSKTPKPNSRTDGDGGKHRPSAGTANRGCQSELSAALSASLRDELLREIESLKTGDEAALWAQRRLGAKSTLHSVDAAHVERGFQDRLMSFTSDAATASIQLHRSGQGKKRSRSATIDKTVLALPAPRRIRDRDHVKSVTKQPCLVCGRRPADAHHLRFAQSPALGRKVSDEFTVPLCRGHHREVHRCGDESAWWKRTGIDPSAAARALWLKTHPLPSAVAQAGSKLRNEANLEAGSL